MRFCADGDHPHSLAHADAVAATVASHVRPLTWFNAVVFGPYPAADPLCLADALVWMARMRVRVVVCALGVAVDAVRDDEAARTLRMAVRQLDAVESIVVAAAPARGAAVWPATLPEVLSVSGDARCAPDEWSHLDSAQAAWGGSVQYRPRTPVDGRATRAGGASIAAAHFAGHVGALLAHTDGSAAEVLARLEKGASYRGPERRS